MILRIIKVINIKFIIFILQWRKRKLVIRKNNIIILFFTLNSKWTLFNSFLTDYFFEFCKFLKAIKCFFFFKLEILKNLNFKIYVILSKKRNRKKFIFKIMDKNNKNNNNANSSH